jgi:drug/metabolite transporter (DMT)-like permease
MPKPHKDTRSTGIRAALLSALLLGMVPIFGKQAMLLGFPPLAVVAWRTMLAAFLLMGVMVIFQRKYLYIYPAGMIGCFLAGSINGIGSLLYYTALGRLDASVGQLLYAFYPLFVALWLSLDHQPLTRLTLARLSLAIPALYLLTQDGKQAADLLGMGMMLGASAMYALHLPINQRVLYDMPAPTVTLYTLISMTIIVVPAYFISGASANLGSISHSLPTQAWLAVLALTLVTFLSRLALFLGVKHLGGMQTALLGLGELLVAVVLAHLWLGDRFSLQQWCGAALLLLGLCLVVVERNFPKPSSNHKLLNWLRPPELSDQ